MIEKIVLNEVKKNFYQINIKEGDNLTLLDVSLKDCLVPFGVEEYNNKYNVNFEADNQNEFILLIRLIEKNILTLLDLDDSYEVTSVFSKKKHHNILCKSYLKKNSNLIISKYYDKGKECSIFDLVKMKKYSIELEISGIWIFKKKCGLYLNIKRINSFE